MGANVIYPHPPLGMSSRLPLSESSIEGELEWDNSRLTLSSHLKQVDVPLLGIELTHEVSRGGVQCGQAAYTQDRNICPLGIYTPSIYLLPRRGKYTRVYTIVYLHVHNCIHTCTQHRSKYVLCRALPYVHSSGITPSHSIYAPIASSDMD